LNAISQQLNLLKYYMGMPVTQPISIPETSLDELQATVQAQILVSEVDVSRLSPYLVLKKQEELLDFQRRANIAEYYPNLSLGANYIYNTQSNSFNLYTNNALNYDMSAINLTLRIPIFDGGARKSRVSQASIDVEKIRVDLENTSNALQMAFENARMQMKNSLTTI